VLLASVSRTTSARNRDAKPGDDGFGVGKQAGFMFDLVCKIFITKISINILFFINDLL
jgi:hypothetical protein